MTSTSAPRSRTRSRLITAFLSLLAIIGVLVLVVGGYGIWSVQRAFPQTDDTLQVNGLHQQVTVQRDAHGTRLRTAAALRNAQLQLLRDGATRHPFYWAPFIVVGDLAGPRPPSAARAR